MNEFIAVALAVVGVIGFVILKLVAGAKAESDQALKDAEIERANQARAAMEAELAKKAEQERQELNEKIDRITAAGDLGGALDLLNRLRGVN